MREEKAIDGAVGNDRLHALVGFERHDDVIQLRNVLRPEYVQGRMIERDPPHSRAYGTPRLPISFLWRCR